MSSNCFLGDSFEILKTEPASTYDSLVTDPPAGISFMGKDWDSNKGGRDGWISWMTSVMKECHRVMKPGAHGLVWAIPRTSHWTATALENAGFQVRDVITHLFGSGFPKSHNLGEGWGTALKPASEHWILVRKPCSEKTVAKNVEKWGVGGINIDASRITGIYKNEGGGSFATGKFKNSNRSDTDKDGLAKIVETKTTGRFPANLILDEEAAQLLDQQSGILHGAGNVRKSNITAGKSIFGIGGIGKRIPKITGDSGGGASRFFYCAKASKKDRNEGLENAEKKIVSDGRAKSIDNPFLRGETERLNTHPTVKSTKLMEYLITLITPPKGKVLDPFMGSGSTGVAAKKLGFDFTGIEQSQEYFEIAEKRIQSPKEKS